ncbi:DsbA family protein [Plastorhodobacter daqingensis]|uniref:DsbA family protein n=1 Tax=Plastorhodobacter daqingensis TaxID=1387281 RepID=A0ABW2ULX3_9RHOB
MTSSRLTLGLASGLVAGLALAAPADAFDIGAMSAPEREAFGEAVRSYLMENPEVLVEAITVLEQRQFAQAAENDGALIAMNRDAILDDGHSWVGGNLEGDVTLVEFVDYRCGFCRRAHPEVEALIAQDGNIRLILKEFPILGEQSTLASRFAVAVQQQAGDDSYKAAHDALMELRGDVTIPTLERLAGELGLDAPAVIAHMNAESVSEVLRANHQLAERLRISGTPTFILEDQMLRGYLPLEGMQEMVAAVRDN